MAGAIAGCLGMLNDDNGNDDGVGSSVAVDNELDIDFEITEFDWGVLRLKSNLKTQQR